MPIQSGSTSLTQIPGAVLPDCNGIEQSLAHLCSDRVSVIFFSCNHCPYVQWVEQAVGQLSHNFRKSAGLQFVAMTLSPTLQTTSLGCSPRVNAQGGNSRT